MSSYTSDLMGVTMRLMLERYGSYDGIRSVSKYDPVLGVHIFPETHPDDEILINKWALSNYDKLWKDEKALWYDDYMAGRCNVKPSWIEKLIHRIKIRA